MATEIIMPKLGVTMSEGSIVRWMKQDGDTVTKDEPLFEVQTDKAIESTLQGMMQGIPAKLSAANNAQPK